MAKVKFSLEETLAITTAGGAGESAMSNKHPRYKKLKKRFKKNVLAMDYEKDLEKNKKKKLKESIADKLDAAESAIYQTKESIENLEINMKKFKPLKEFNLKVLIDLLREYEEVVNNMEDLKDTYGDLEETNYDIDDGQESDEISDASETCRQYAAKAIEVTDEAIRLTKNAYKLKGFDRIKALETIKKYMGIMSYSHYKKAWPIGIREVEQETKKIRDSATKLPKKTMKLKEAVKEEKWSWEEYKEHVDEAKKNRGRPSVLLYNPFFHNNVTHDMFFKMLDYVLENFKAEHKGNLAQSISLAGQTMGKRGKHFDYKKGLDYILKLNVPRTVYELGLSFNSSHIVTGWLHFDHKKALAYLKKDSPEYYAKALKNWPKGVEGAKEITKEIRDKSSKLPKKKMKLESVLSEGTKYTQEELFKILRRRVPEATNVKNVDMGGVSFTYKDTPFRLISDEEQIGLIPDLQTAVHPHLQAAYFQLVPELYQKLKAPTRKEAEKMSKDIRKTSIKLPKKKLKLEDVLK
jgi:hypothetical protein